MLLVKILGSKNSIVCAREGGANTTFLLTAHFAKRNTKFGGGGKIGIGKRGRANRVDSSPCGWNPSLNRT